MKYVTVCSVCSRLLGYCTSTLLYEYTTKYYWHAHGHTHSGSNVSLIRIPVKGRQYVQQ